MEKKYTVIHKTTYQELLNEVNRMYEEEGYECLGGLSCNKNGFYWAMKRIDSSSTSYMNI